MKGHVMTITRGTVDAGTVLVEGGRIVAVADEVIIPEGAEVYDATGKVVISNASGTVAMHHASRNAHPVPRTTFHPNSVDIRLYLT